MRPPSGGPLDVDEAPTEVLDLFADYIHQLWWEWSVALASEENLSEDRLERWRDLWVPYERLDDDEQESDRRRARELLRIVLRHEEL